VEEAASIGDSVVVLEDPRAASPVFTTEGLAKELRQGEIITNFPQYSYSSATGRAKETYKKYIIIVAQECDLLNDYNEFVIKGKYDLNEIIVVEAFEEDIIRNSENLKGIFKQIIQNNVDRFHFFEKVPAHLDMYGTGLPSLIVDFRKIFSAPPEEIYRQFTLAHGAVRRCRLETPYKEHFQSRLAFYLQRVALLVPHRKDVATQPPAANNLSTAAKPDGQAPRSSS
jgi:hypothetical protein